MRTCCNYATVHDTYGDLTFVLYCTLLSSQLAVCISASSLSHSEHHISHQGCLRQHTGHTRSHPLCHAGYWPVLWDVGVFIFKIIVVWSAVLIRLVWSAFCFFFITAVWTHPHHYEAQGQLWSYLCDQLLVAVGAGEYCVWLQSCWVVLYYL